MNLFNNVGVAGIVLVSWIIALPEYSFQVPANRIGFNENGPPTSGSLKYYRK